MIGVCDWFTFATVCLCRLFIIAVSHRLLLRRGQDPPRLYPLRLLHYPFHPYPFLAHSFRRLHLPRTAIRPCLRAARPPSNFKNTASWYSSHSLFTCIASWAAFELIDRVASLHILAFRACPTFKSFTCSSYSASRVDFLKPFTSSRESGDLDGVVHWMACLDAYLLASVALVIHNDHLQNCYPMLYLLAFSYSSYVFQSHW